MYAQKMVKHMQNEWMLRIRFGRKLNLDHPVSLADKIIWLELNKQSSLKVDCTDKYLVRDYLKIKEMGQYLIPLCADPWFSESGY